MNVRTNIVSFIVAALCINIGVLAQEPAKTDVVSLLFIGDIMGHETQITAAYDSIVGRYDYTPVFKPISHLVNNADITIANLEVTLAGEPFSGYPKFSSPDELAGAIKNCGIDAVVTANNHSCDRGSTGLVRTLDVLDRVGLKHTGTFRNEEEKESSNLMVLSEKSLKIGVLNYTYGTNGLRVKSPAIVNLTDTVKVVSDIKKSKNKDLDKLVVFIHWGSEYVSAPSKKQVGFATFLFEHGVDIVIGSHPHVVQRMEYLESKNGQPEHFVAYSLGNFVSNQRTRKRDGGVLVQIELEKNKETGKTTISDCGYHLTWVHKPVVNGSRKFEVLHCLEKEKDGFKGMWEWSQKQFKIFADDSRKLFQKENVNVKEWHQ